MAREKNKQLPRVPEEPQQEEITVVVMKFKGSGQSLQKGFDAVSQAIATLGAPQPAVQLRTFGHRQPAQLGNGHQPPTDSIIDANVEADNIEAENGEEDQDQTPVAKVPRAPRNKPVYTFRDDFKLAPEGVPSLQNYCTEKNPQTVDEKFLVASAWAQRYGGADPFTGGHLFTCFRALGWKTQVDMTQPLRKLKPDKSWYDNPALGKWKLTGIDLTAAENIGICYNHGSVRGAVVMTWNIAYSHLCTYVLANRLTDFNARWLLSMPGMHRNRTRTIAKFDDFNDELKEAEVIAICRDAGIVTRNMYNIMNAALGKRNAAAHPNAVVTDKLQADAYIADLITNVVQQIA